MPSFDGLDRVLVTVRLPPRAAAVLNMVSVAKMPAKRWPCESRTRGAGLPRQTVVVFFRVHFSHPLFLFCAALIAGLLNSVAGGGSFVSFPALLFTGMPAIAANATNTAAVWPGTVASTVAYRNAFDAQARKLLPPLIGIGIIGGVIGAKVLLVTPQATFLRLIPWLMLVATLLFVTGPRITAWVKGRGAQQKSSLVLIVVGFFLALLVSIYIGYFGAGVGILVLSLLALMGMDDIHAMNGLKVFLVSIVNGVAILTFIVANVIVWPQALLMIVASLIGGYAGAYFAQRMNPGHVRWIVVVVGFGMSAYFFVRNWRG